MYIDPYRLMNPDLLQLLACPSTGEALCLSDEGLVSKSGGTEYPLISGVPWLIPNPQNSLTDWGTKLNQFNQVLLGEIKGLESSLKHATGASEHRMQRLLAGKQHFLRRVSELLVPVVSAPAASKKIYDALRDRAPATQNLLSYEANLYRDWVWGEEENRLTAEIVSKKLEASKVDKLLVLGAGAGRLALDVHRAWQPSITVATDINPLLVMAAEYLLQDQTLQFVEFPLQPRNSDCAAIGHEIKGEKKPDNFHFVFSDATKPSFQAEAFDTVVTPWFVDIQPLEFGRFLRQLNQYMPKGGKWINFGSLVFNQNRDALCYSIEEVQEIAASQGFKIENIEEHEIPYLKSPYNAGYRVERVWSWSAEKVEDVKPLVSPQVLPTWLLDTAQPIPTADMFKQFAFTHRVYAQLAADVDGKTSVTKISKKLAKQNKMDEAEALHLVSEFFADLHRQNS